MCVVVVVVVVDIVVVSVAFRYRVRDVPPCAASCVLEPFSNSPLAKWCCLGPPFFNFVLKFAANDVFSPSSEFFWVDGIEEFEILLVGVS